MEDASNALIMAAGILIGVLILSLAVYLFINFGQTAAQIYEQNEQNQLNIFNSKFSSYEGKEKITIYDIITVAGYAYENNKYYEDDEQYKVYVYIGTPTSNNEIQDIVYLKSKKIISDEQNKMDGNNNELPKYSCKIEYLNGRVKNVIFSEL